jgi:triosephosphate isomerase (TIM)
MTRVPFVGGNWKMNLDRAKSVDLAQAVAEGATGLPVDVGVAPPFVYLDAVREALQGSKVWLGAQDAYFQQSGAFTGEISLDMLKDVGCRFVLNGHSERRHVLNETPELLAKKADAIYKSGLVLVHCVGEKLEERDTDKTLHVCGNQLDEIKGLLTDPAKLVIAYEPVWAIGTGRNATDPEAQEVQLFVRDWLAKNANRDYADRVRIIYGGSMKPENAQGLMEQADVDGGLIGGASLKADSFLAICKTAAGWYEKEKKMGRN